MKKTEVNVDSAVTGSEPIICLRETIIMCGPMLIKHNFETSRKVGYRLFFSLR